MGDGLVEITSADAGLRAALVDAALPIEDLDQSNGRFFRHERSGVLAGFGGFEMYGRDALLRSVVVVPAARGTGAGRRITELLLARMKAAGVERAYLLTDTAEDFFRHMGFGATPRGAAPDAIRATRQATTICASAAMLTRETE
jgi:N-acetylglutamate synthase-like GNAT family acetyltransferase